MRYAVAGGWVPLLAEPTHPTLMHPGTRDVDVLLMDEESAVQAAAKALLKAGFRPSAKHEFQLLRDARVGDYEFVFNVDLMHPNEAGSTPDTYNDIFDMGVNDAYDPRGSRFAKSIAFSSAAIVYEQNLFRTVEVSALDLDDVLTTVTLPILAPSAAVLSKCESVKVPKRTRDAFDLYYLLTGENGEALGKELRELGVAYPQVQGQLDHLKRFLEEQSDRFNQNVAQHARRWISSAAEDSFDRLFGRGLEPAAAL
ncbi:MAG: hypothetical protein U1C74_23520 [Phenylobacterium sp.]|nr:hypothetical protein [Phenylobacterium sp.]